MTIYGKVTRAYVPTNVITIKLNVRRSRLVYQILRIAPSQNLMYMPMWDPSAESLVTGASQDDHDGGPAAGVASGFDPSGGEPCYQFGNQWVRACHPVQPFSIIFPQQHFGRQV